MHDNVQSMPLYRHILDARMYNIAQDAFAVCVLGVYIPGSRDSNIQYSLDFTNFFNKNFYIALNIRYIFC